jgi:hypothetical protein
MCQKNKNVLYFGMEGVIFLRIPHIASIALSIRRLAQRTFCSPFCLDGSFKQFQISLLFCGMLKWTDGVLVYHFICIARDRALWYDNADKGLAGNRIGKER